MGDGLPVPQLHQIAQVHHADAVGHIGNHVQIVGDKQVGQAELLAQIQQQVQHLGLDGDVQSGDGLVADHKVRVQNQGDGNGHTLALAAGKLVGPAGAVALVQAHGLEDLAHLLVPLLLGLANAVDFQGLLNEPANGLVGVDGGVGVLEDNLHLLAQILALPAGRAGDVPPV